MPSLCFKSAVLLLNASKCFSALGFNASQAKHNLFLWSIKHDCFTLTFIWSYFPLSDVFKAKLEVLENGSNLQGTVTIVWVQPTWVITHDYDPISEITLRHSCRVCMIGADLCIPE